MSESSSSSDSSSFVRIGSLDLKGKVVANIKSRPLKKDLAEAKLALDTFDALGQKIKTQSLENLASTGRRGCTTDELYTMVQKYVSGLIQDVLIEVLNDVAGGGTKTLDNVDKVVKLSKKNVSKYFNEAGEWTGEQAQNKLAERLATLGLTDDSQSKQAADFLAKKLKQSSDKLLSNNERLQGLYNNFVSSKDQQGEENS